MLDHFKRGACYLFLHWTFQASYSFPIHIIWWITENHLTQFTLLASNLSMFILHAPHFLFILIFFPSHRISRLENAAAMDTVRQKQHFQSAARKGMLDGFCRLCWLLSLPFPGCWVRSQRSLVPSASTWRELEPPPFHKATQQSPTTIGLKNMSNKMAVLIISSQQDWVFLFVCLLFFPSTHIWFNY